MLKFFHQNVDNLFVHDSAAAIARHADPFKSEKSPESPPSPEGFVLTRRIGRGLLSVVYEAYNGETKEFRSLKYVQLAMYGKDSRKDLSLLRSIVHPNLVRTYDLLEIPKQFFVIVQELYDHGSLDDLLREYLGHGLNLPVKDILTGLSALHGRNLIHQNMQLPTCHLTWDGHVALGGMETGRLYTASHSYAKETYSLCYYTCPEMLKSRVSPSVATDLWSVGVVAFALCALQLPFVNSQLITAYTAPNVLPATHSMYHSEVQPVLETLLSLDPRSRGTPAQLLGLPLFKNL